MNKIEIWFLEEFVPNYVMKKGKETRFWRIIDGNKYVDVIFDHDYERMLVLMNNNPPKVIEILKKFAEKVGYDFVPIVNYLSSKEHQK